MKTEATWECGAKHRHIGSEVQDCDWPFCGCDPYAGKVLEAIAESGFALIRADVVSTHFDPVFKCINVATESISADRYDKQHGDLRSKWLTLVMDIGTVLQRVLKENTFRS